MGYKTASFNPEAHEFYFYIIYEPIALALGMLYKHYIYVYKDDGYDCIKSKLILVIVTP